MCQGGTQSIDDVRLAERGGLQASFLRFVVIGAIEREPNRLECIRIVGTARKEVPMKMGDLVAKRFTIQFAWLKSLRDGLAEGYHFFKKGRSVGPGKLV
jgi:hypothetical protein